jgi:hypothetical protein
LGAEAAEAVETAEVEGVNREGVAEAIKDEETAGEDVVVDDMEKLLFLQVTVLYAEGMAIVPVTVTFARIIMFTLLKIIST